MKKFLAFVLALICVFGLAACAAKTEKDNPVKNESSEKKADEWGITLEVDNVTSRGLTIVCHQSNGENVSELNTGSYYVIQKSEKDGWTDVECLPQEYHIAWTSESWVIQKENTTRWNVNWEWLYGELPAGDYRIGKEIMNFRGAGDYDTEMVFADFVIK